MTATRRTLLLLACFEGTAVMMAQLAGAKMLAPIYGSSLYVWGSVVGVTLASLTAGYYLGGRLSLRSGRLPKVVWFMLLAAGLIALMPALARPLLPLLVELGTVPAILLLSSGLLGPALVLLGATSPLLISLLTKRVEEAGRASGTVYGVSTLGGIAGTFLAGFVLIPELGLTRTALIAALVLGLLPLVLLLRHRRPAALGLPAAVAGVLLLGPAPATHPDVDVIYHSEGLLGQLKVIDFTRRDAGGRAMGTERILFVNRTAQTWIMRDSGEPIWDYMRYIQSVASVLPEGSRVLLLGLGGGTIAQMLQDIGLQVDSVELDARIARVASEHFGLAHSGDIFIDDGRRFLRVTDRRYELIIFDVYQAEVPPAHLLTLETFRGLDALLEPGGFFIVNYSGYLQGATGRGARSIYRTLLDAVEHVAAIPTASDEDSGNNLFIGSREPIDFSRPRQALLVGGRLLRLEDLLLPTDQIPLDDALILRDNRPVLEKLNLEAAARWRRGYYDYFTRPLLDQGIPIFE